MMNNPVATDKETKDLEEYLRVENEIKKEFENGIKTELLKMLRAVFINGSDFAKSGKLMEVLLQGREMLKNG